ncbi:PadR family transcriptional regulator [Millisia brevis]|uniref:PadR family transcriptional regulator n=1 Tax=Millisia brevis TaxID=264148 RepID=UPI000834F4DE|nr:PadR family transcriptional regulator [Millisia brevis]
MALRDAILVTLLDGESSGYDLAKSFDNSVANFWTAAPQQLYRELDRMEAEGLLAGRRVEQERRPNKRVFSITDAGLEAVAEFIRREPKPTALRDEMMVQVQGVEWGDIDSVRAAVAARVELAETKLKRYLRLRDRLLGGLTEADYLVSAPRVGPYLTLARGIGFEEENVRWGTTTLEILARRAERAQAATGD